MSFTQNSFHTSRLINYLWVVEAVPTIVRRRYSDLSDLMKSLVFAESAIFATRTQFNVRSKMCQNDELNKLSYDGQVPVFVLCHLLAYNIFTDASLRHLFTVQYPSGSTLPLGVKRLYNNLRETRSSNVNISFKQESDENVKFFENTILSNTYLKKNAAARSIAFSVLSGTLFATSYSIKVSTYTELSLVTNLSNCNSIVVTSYSYGDYCVDVSPWSTTQRRGRLFDPLIEHLYISVLGGSHLIKENGQSQDFSDNNLNYLEVKISPESYWFQYIYFFIDNPVSNSSLEETEIFKDNNITSSDNIRKLDKKELKQLVLSIKSNSRKSDKKDLQLGYFIPI